MPIPWTWRGHMPYATALAEQRTHRDAMVAGEAGEAIWLLEHESVVTVGRRAAADLPSADALASAGVGLHKVERGGLATWHGPGQLVAYVMVDAAGRGLGVKGLVCALEAATIDWLASLGIEAARRPGSPGIWVGDDKICALGLHFRRGISMHGLAINLAPDMANFAHIVPCGIVDGGVTSVAILQGRAPKLPDAAGALGPRLASAIEGGKNCP